MRAEGWYPPWGGAPAPLPRHFRTGVHEWHSLQANGTDWDSWLEEFMLHQVDASTGAELPARLVSGSLLQHLSMANRTAVVGRMRAEGLMRGSAQLRAMAAGAVVGAREAASQQDAAQRQLQFILDFFETREDECSGNDASTQVFPRTAVVEAGHDRPPSDHEQIQNHYNIQQHQPPPPTSTTPDQVASEGAPSISPPSSAHPPDLSSEELAGRSPHPPDSSTSEPAGGSSPSPPTPPSALKLSGKEASRKRKAMSPLGGRGGLGFGLGEGVVCVCGGGEAVYAASYSARSRPRWCAACPELPDGAVDVTGRRARCECGRGRRMMAMAGESASAARWCGRCPGKPAGAVLVVQAKLCECGRSNPCFGLAGGSAKRWCALCPTKPPEAQNVTRKMCECGEASARYALPGKGRLHAQWCSKCPSKPAHAVNVLKQFCECGKGGAQYGMPGEAARWCSTCKPTDAVDVKVALSGGPISPLGSRMPEARALVGLWGCATTAGVSLIDWTTGKP